MQFNFLQVERFVRLGYTNNIKTSGGKVALLYFLLYKAKAIEP